MTEKYRKSVANWTIFKESGERSRNVHLDWLEEYTPNAMAEAFKISADRIVELCAVDAGHPDKFFFPVAYLYRHYLELQFKVIIEDATKLDLFQDVNYSTFGHQLTRLWDDTQQILMTIYPNNDIGDLAPIERVVNQMDAADPDGQSFRYFRNRKGDVNLQLIPRVLSLDHLKNEMDSVYTLLSGCECVVSHAVEWEREMKSEFGG